MAGKTVIDVNDVGIMFHLNKEKVDNLKEYFIKFVTRKLSYNEFWALRNVSFKVEAGDRLGILGFNGAGKSTLLKLIAGVMKPTEGSIKVHGVIAPLLELGAGFDPNYTGAENIYLYGATLGYSRKFIEEKYNEIAEFSELGDFLDVPLKNYSSGMKARLGFSIATAVEPEILILDEVLSVGDAKFRAKSEEKIQRMIANGVTVLFVSHSIEQVKRICNKAILLSKGELIASGTSRGRGPYDWKKGAKFYVGGSMTNLASLTGWVDEVQIWSKALTATEVQEAMKGYATAPANLEGYFTFEETKTDSEGYIYFPNVGKNAAAVPGGYMTTGKEENGRTNDYKQNQLTTTLGVPMLTGVYPVNYESTQWMIEGARLNSSTATTANATYNSGDGKFPIKVVATNSWGSTTKTIEDYMVVTSIEGVDAEAGYMVYPNPFEGTANVLFAQDGLFEVAVFAADGKLVANDAFEVRAGELREISLASAEPGVYVVVIMKEGVAVRSFKIKK